MFNMSAIQILKEQKANSIKSLNGTIVSKNVMAKWDGKCSTISTNR
jgi:hypothetical protein